MIFNSEQLNFVRVCCEKSTDPSFITIKNPLTCDEVTYALQSVKSCDGCKVFSFEMGCLSSGSYILELKNNEQEILEQRNVVIQ